MASEGQIAIPCVLMRGGASKEPFFLASALPSDPQLRDRVLLAVMGSPNARHRADGRHVRGRHACDDPSHACAPTWLLARGSARATHVIDEKRHGQAAQRALMLEKALRIEVQVHVPAERSDEPDDAVELRRVGHAAEMLHEIEAHAAAAALVQLLEVALGEGAAGVGDAAVAAAAAGNGIETVRFSNAAVRPSASRVTARHFRPAR